MNHPIMPQSDDLAFPIHKMLGISESTAFQVETVSGPTTAVTLKVTLVDDPGKGFFVKTLKKGTPPGPHLNLGLREVRFYAFIDSLGFDPSPYLPKCVNHFIAGDETGYFLVLEDLSGSHRGYESVDFSRLESWKPPLRALAEFHRAYTGQLTIEQVHNHSDGRQAVENYIQKLEKAFQQFKIDHQDIVDEVVLALLARSIPLIHAFELDKLARIRENKLITILNRDAHLRNFLYPCSAAGEAVIVDWQFWGLGIGTFDLRHLLGSALQGDLRKHQEELVRYYYDQYQQGLDSEYTWGDCWDDYRKSIIDNLFMPVWQYNGFGWTYEKWGSTLAAAVENYDVLGCEEFEKAL